MSSGEINAHKLVAAFFESNAVLESEVDIPP